eukprot:GILI01018005.1.p1 GENE.GILI01018005.1~~GILI01018005.1.p1  ORF type:complete len:751 (-),score=88.42 GILI01018005.1:165-2417(-)
MEAHPSSPTSPTSKAAARYYWIPCFFSMFLWAGVTATLFYLGDYIYDDAQDRIPYKDAGFLGSFDWSTLDGGELQHWLNQGYAIGHGALLILFALLSGKDRLTILRRMFFIATVSQILYQIQMMATRLPDPNLYEVGRRWRYINMPSQYTYGGFFIQFYSGSIILRILSWAVSFGGIFILVPTHYLYTVDVITGIITGLAVFLVYHWQVRTTYTICQVRVLAWFEIDFLRWHSLDEIIQDVVRAECRERADSVSTVTFVENLVVGRSGPENTERGSQVARNEAIIAASLAPPLLPTSETETEYRSFPGSETARRDSNKGSLQNSVVRGPAYAAGGESGFNRFGYGDRPNSEYLMEHFQAPAYTIDSATAGLTTILDELEQKHYKLPNGMTHAPLDSRPEYNTVTPANAQLTDTAAPLISPTHSSIEVGPETRNSSSVSLQPANAADNSQYRKSVAEGRVLGFTVANSVDPSIAAAERRNWIRRQLIVAASTISAIAFGGTLAMLNEVPIGIADKNRPIGIPLPPDFIHNYLPKVPDHTPDFMMYPLVAVVFLYIFLNRFRWVILRRTAIWYGVCMGGRCLTVPATFLPDPSPICRLPQHPAGTTCGDMIYSGHTITVCAALSVILKYVDPLWVRTGASAYAFMTFLAIICSRLHYTRDVLTALMVCATTYHLFHRGLVHRVDIYVRYHFLRYFEMDYFMFLIEDRQMAREGRTRRYLWVRGGIGETFAQIADAYTRRRDRRQREKARLLK